MEVGPQSHRIQQQFDAQLRKTHIFNFHHKESPLLQNYIKNKNSSKKQFFKQEGKITKASSLFEQSSLKKKKIDIFQHGIESINSYYKNIMLHIQRFKKQEIDFILKLKENAYKCWGSTLNTRLNNKIQTVKWQKMSVEQDFDPNKSPFLKNKNLYDAAFSQIKTMLSNLKNNIKMFPIVGPACICLFDRKTDEKTIKGSLKCLQKGSQVLNISNINNKECEKSKFVSKKAFRELFSEEVEQEKDLHQENTQN